jgi:hypothetical protein
MADLNLKSGEIAGVVKGYQFRLCVSNGIIPFHMVRAAAENAGLPMSFWKEPTVRRAMLRAANEVAKTNGRFKDRLSRKVCEKPDHAVVAIVDEERDEAGEQLDYDVSTKIVLNKVQKYVTAEGVLAGEFYQNYNSYSKGLTGDDIRFALYRIVRLFGNAISLIDSGHLYFLPEKNADLLEKINDFLSQLHIGRVYATEIIDSRSSNGWVWDAATQNIKTRVRNIVRNIDVKMRESSYDKKKDALDETKSLMDLYAELTGYSAATEEMLEEIAEAENLVAECALKAKQEKEEKVAGGSA